MVPTPLSETSDAFFLCSGDVDIFDTHRATLGAVGGQSEFLDSDPGHAAPYDLGMLDLFFVGMAGFLHASALVGADGVKAVHALMRRAIARGHGSDSFSRVVDQMDSAAVGANHG